MKATGVIAEYNPLHNGHIYHIRKSKELTNADVMIAVMSGHFLQRGEPAIMDKWTRASIALHSGIDVVFELPAVYSTQSAQLFAYGSVSLLEQLDCVQSLCFGSELGNIHVLKSLSEVLLHEPPELALALQKQLQNGLPYPKAMEKALFETNLMPFGNDTLQANNTLGLMYLVALGQLKSSIKPYTLQRKATSFHQTSITDATLASATAIRKLITENNNDFLTIKPYVPEATFSYLANSYSAIINLDDFRDILFSKLYEMSATTLLSFIDLDAGLAKRIKKHIFESTSIIDLISKIKCKNYTWVRIQRALIHVLLDMKKHELLPLQASPYARVLGFTKKGQQFLKLAKKRSSIPIINQWGQETFLYSRYDQLATRIYSLVEVKKCLHVKSLNNLATRDFRVPPIQV